MIDPEELLLIDPLLLLPFRCCRFAAAGAAIAGAVAVSLPVPLLLLSFRCFAAAPAVINIY